MSASAAVTLTRFRMPKAAVGRFVFRRTLRSATFWALIFGMYVASKAAGYAAAYPDVASRQAIAKSFGSNLGLTAMLGKPEGLTSVGGFTTWNTLGVMILVGGIWAFLLATKTFRGEEQAGRSELFLAGQTTARRAAASTLAGLLASLSTLYLVSASAFVLVGKLHNVNLAPSAALFFALCVVGGLATFMAVGMLASQLMPTRGRAAGLSAAVLGVFFLLRAMGDTTSASWLLNLTPLGWIEKLRPLYGSQPLWLIPIGLFVAVVATVAMRMAGARDLGDSTFADKDSARPHLRLLGTPLGAAIRLTRATTFTWTLAIALLATAFGFLTKAAIQALQDTAGSQKILDRLAHSQTGVGEAFLSILFLMIMVVMMSFMASSIGAMRETEAEGYLDNLLVRPVSRLQWLGGRVSLSIGALVAAALLAGVGAWVGQASEHVGISFARLLLAGVNTIAPALLTLGIGVWAFGFVPRFTTLVTYGVIAWSFLINMIGSGLNLNHWLLDTSVLQHVALGPASNPNWTASVMLVAIGAVAAALGALRFRTRDLQNE